MRDYKQDLIDENNEANHRARELSIFMDTDAFKALDSAEIKLINRQMHIMHLLCDVLAERVWAL